VDAKVLGPGLAPTPFTAEEIRAGCPEGRTIELLVVSAGESYRRVNRFVACDETGATIERGRVGGPVESARVTWAQLQAHAAFPAAVTVVEPERIDIPLGVLDCLRYTVRDGDDVTVFWFAPAFPGMPVRIRVEVQSQVVSTTTMVASIVG
jgi:hypothetical protein